MDTFAEHIAQRKVFINKYLVNIKLLLYYKYVIPIRFKIRFIRYLIKLYTILVILSGYYISDLLK